MTLQHQTSLLFCDVKILFSDYDGDMDYYFDSNLHLYLRKTNDFSCEQFLKVQEFSLFSNKAAFIRNCGKSEKIYIYVI